MCNCSLSSSVKLKALYEQSAPLFVFSKKVNFLSFAFLKLQKVSMNILGSRTSSIAVIGQPAVESIFSKTIFFVFESYLILLNFKAPVSLKFWIVNIF